MLKYYRYGLIHTLAFKMITELNLRQESVLHAACW